jgi:tetratricopeptide (TPR) repeat protein
MVLRWNVKPPGSERFSAEDMLAARKSLGMTVQSPAAAPVPIPLSRPVRLAIGGLGLANDEQNNQIADLLASDLKGVQGLELIDRLSLDKVLHETELNLSGLVRAKDAIHVGKLLRADWFLLGTAMHGKESNGIVARIVDARTGIFRDTTVASADKASQKLAEELAGFVGKCRTNAASAKTPVYLALGAFEDLSLNNRLTEFPAQLRAYLTAAYRGTAVTLLERDHVDTLLQEIQLDLAGLTDTVATNTSPGMQTAFWLVEGDYQSYETKKAEVQLSLKITRIFGSHNKTLIRDVPGEPMFRRVKGTLDEVLQQKQGVVYPTRASEARVQMARGRELAPATDFFGEPYRELTEQEAKRERRTVEEAIRAFKAVLLLDPTNREAKFNLAACYCKPVIGRTDEGRKIYQEVLDAAAEDQWQGKASRWLVSTFEWADPAEAFQWFSTAEKQSGSTNLQAFYRQQAEEARTSMVIRGPDRTQAQLMAEKRLLKFISSCEGVMKGKSGTSGGAYGMYDYVDTFAKDKLKAGQSLAQLLPRLTSAFPDLAPHLTAAALEFQRETNNSVVGELQRQLELCRARPEKIFGFKQFWNEVRYQPYIWCMHHGEFTVAVQIMEGVRQVAQHTNSVSFDNEDKIALAFAYKGTQQWKEAIEIFECFSNLPVVMHRGDGPWGRAFQPLLTGKEVTYCQERLGIRTSNDPREFDMGTNVLCMHTPSAFAANSEGVWIAIDNRLIQLDFDTHTNFVEVLPKASWTGINCLLVGPSSIWVGTDGEGLFEFDKIGRRTRRYTEKDGLMNDIVSSLSLAGDTLWIGYGVKEGPTGYYVSRVGGGGLGSLNLTKHEFHNFTPSLEIGAEAFRDLRGPEPLNIPPRRTVSAILVGPDSDVWFSARSSPLRKYRQTKDAWEGLPEIGGQALTANSDHLFIGGFWNYMQPPKSGPLGVTILSFADKKRSALKDFGVLPTGMVSALRLDGNHLWVGGAGYIAKIDPVQNELLRFASIRSTLVDQIYISGGFVWAQFDRHLHRAKLP